MLNRLYQPATKLQWLNPTFRWKKHRFLRRFVLGILQAMERPPCAVADPVRDENKVDEEA